MRRMKAFRCHRWFQRHSRKLEGGTENSTASELPGAKGARDLQTRILKYDSRRSVEERDSIYKTPQADIVDQPQH